MYLVKYINYLMYLKSQLFVVNRTRGSIVIACILWILACYRYMWCGV